MQTIEITRRDGHELLNNIEITDFHEGLLLMHPLDGLEEYLASLFNGIPQGAKKYMPGLYLRGKLL